MGRFTFPAFGRLERSKTIKGARQTNGSKEMYNENSTIQLQEQDGNRDCHDSGIGNLLSGR